jgi:colicin import membrane protein
MSLTLEEVRRVRFRMARPRETGYAVADVDNFIDKVEESFAAFENDRDLMRRELESAGTGGGGDDSAELNEVRAALGSKDQELDSLRHEVERLKQEAAQARQEAENASAQVSGNVDEQLARLGSSNQELQRQNGELEAQVEQLRNQLEATREELNQARNDRITGGATGQPQHITVHAADDAAPAVTRLLQMATDQASTLVNEAETEAARKISDAEQRATEIKTDARTRAERIESEARVNAEQMTTEAESRASRLDSDTENRRRELFSDLERKQGELTVKVDALRRFESEYRTNLGQSLQRMLHALTDDHPEPGDVPELAQQRSDTPRLDALAGGSEE